jgi:CRISPR-associated protein Csy1
MTFEEALQGAKGHHSRGELLEAIEAYVRALEQEPGHAEAWHLKGLAEHQSGRLDAALASVRQAISTGGERPPFLLLEGDVLHDRGDLEAAEKRFGRVVELAPGWPAGHLALGRVRMDRGRVAEALDAFRGAAEAEPGHARAWNNVGVALESLERFDEATAAFEKSVSLDPAYALAHLNLARLLDARDSRRARAHAESALRANPRLPDAWLLLHGLHRRAFAFEPALAAVDHGLRYAPEDARLLNARAELLAHMGKVEESREAFVEVARRFPSSFRAALGAHLLLPRVYESREHLDRSRGRYREGLKALADTAERFRFETPAAALAEASWVNFYLAYQGCDDRALQSDYGSIVRSVLRPRLPEFFEARGRAGRERLRIGFLSHFFFNCVVGRYFASWITDLDRGAFETFVYYTNETVANDTRAIAAAAHAFRHVSGRPLAAIARQVLADELDVLIYPELGMHPETFALAALRLAPVQCAAWGHPTTTGLPEIDWFVSSAEMEPEDAQRHYSEELAVLPGLGTRYAMPRGDPAGDRAAFGIPEDRTAYLVPLSLFKIHPDNDDLVARVLERDPSGVALMFPSSQEPQTRAFVDRAARAFKRRGLDFGERVRFLEFVPHATYLRINALCDVMLDTLHWSGGNTTLDALASGLPVVTLPGSLMRGRQSAAMLRQVGVPELIARDVDDYVEIAVRLGGSGDERRALGERIARGRGELFDRGEPIRALEAFLASAAGRG